jgi:hypothetical protein
MHRSVITYSIIFFLLTTKVVYLVVNIVDTTFVIEFIQLSLLLPITFDGLILEGELLEHNINMFNPADTSNTGNIGNTNNPGNASNPGNTGDPGNAGDPGTPNSPIPEDQDSNEEEDKCGCSHNGGSQCSNCSHDRIKAIEIQDQNDSTCCICGTIGANCSCAKANCACEMHEDCLDRQKAEQESISKSQDKSSTDKGNTDKSNTNPGKRGRDNDSDDDVQFIGI